MVNTSRAQRTGDIERMIPVMTWNAKYVILQLHILQLKHCFNFIMSSSYTKLHCYRFKGRIYDRCITHANQGTPWCATATDSVTYSVQSRGNCAPSANVNDCPIGFRWAYSEATCYRVGINCSTRTELRTLVKR